MGIIGVTKPSRRLGIPWPTSMPVLLQALLAYVQLAALLKILDIKWPSALGRLFKFYSWIMNTSPQVQEVAQDLSRNNCHTLPL